jgi:hypothetical protein
MANCPYLKLEQSHCAGCTGWRCLAFGRKKKISDPSTCQNEEEWDECPRYVDATTKPSGIGVLGMPRLTPRVTPLPPPQAPQCEYLGIPPGGEACCFMWCYGGNVPLRTTKTCHSPSSMTECRYFIKASRAGVKPYASA